MPKYDKVLKVKPVPVPPGYDHPEPPNQVLPKHEFTLGLIAPKVFFIFYILTVRVLGKLH